MFHHLVSRPCLLALGALPALLGSCAAVLQGGEPPESTQFRGTSDRVTELAPADIAVAPVRNQSGRSDLPAASFRQAFAKELTNRLYSPLSLPYVDANWVESSFAGTPAPDALLVVAITEWNPDHLYSSGKVRVSADLYLFEGGSTTGSPLWGINLTRTIDLSDGHGNPPAPADYLRRKAIQLFAGEALAELPERDPLAAAGVQASG
jgi:hypothetical protein